MTGIRFEACALPHRPDRLGNHCSCGIDGPCCRLEAFYLFPPTISHPKRHRVLENLFSPRPLSRLPLILNKPLHFGSWDQDSPTHSD